jgi:hypothetical protein
MAPFAEHAADKKKLSHCPLYRRDGFFCYRPIIKKQRDQWVELQVDPFAQSDPDHGGRERPLKFDKWRVVAAAQDNWRPTQYFYRFT